jgi:DNA-binding XRE family transcriptional regulator
MKQDKRRRLERAGWQVSDTATFLGLTAAEQRFIDLKRALAAGLRQLRERRGFTQAALAKRLGSSQSRIAKLEAADASVSVDLMIRSLLRVGAGPADIAKIIRSAAIHEAA